MPTISNTLFTKFEDLCADIAYGSYIQVDNYTNADECKYCGFVYGNYYSADWSDMTLEEKHNPLCELIRATQILKELEKCD